MTGISNPPHPNPQQPPCDQAPRYGTLEGRSSGEFLTHEEDLDLLDLLVSFASHWKMIIGGSLIAAIGTMIYFQTQGARYASSMLFTTPIGLSNTAENRSLLSEERLQAILYSENFKSKLIASLGTKVDSALLDQLAQDLGYQNLLKVELDRKIKLLKIVVEAPKKEWVEALSQKIPEVLMSSSREVGIDRSRLQKLLEALEQENLVLKRLQEVLLRRAHKDLELNSSDLTIANKLTDKLSENQKNKLILEAELEGITPSFIVSQFTPPRNKSNPLIKGVLVFFGVSFFLFLLFVIKDSLSNSSKNPLKSQKLQKLRESWSL